MNEFCFKIYAMIAFEYLCIVSSGCSTLLASHNRNRQMVYEKYRIISENIKIDIQVLMLKIKS